jgi:hypothetical protein
MKLSAETIELLKNYATINPSILIREGNILSTCSPQKSIFTRATITESFPQQIAIYELNKFLGVLSLFDDPELTFSDKTISIQSEKRKMHYTCADESMIIAPPANELKFPAANVEFELNQIDLQKVVRASGVLQLPDIAVIGKDGKISISAVDSKTPTANEYTIEVADTDLNFTAIFKADNIIKLISSDYNVKISNQAISKFTLKSGTIVYYVATEKNSKFGE